MAYRRYADEYEDDHDVYVGVEDDDTDADDEPYEPLDVWDVLPASMRG